MNSTPRQGAASNAERAAHHPYVGMWITADGYIRHELLPEAAMTKPAARSRAPTRAAIA